MTMHVLIINPQLAFTVALKQALERTGSYVVHPFTSADAALDYLRGSPQDIALIHADVTAAAGLALVREVRKIQRDLPLIISPGQPETVLDTLLLQGSIDEPFQARDLIPLLNKAITAREFLAQAADQMLLPTDRLEGDPEAAVKTDRFGDQPDDAESIDAREQVTSLDRVLGEQDNIFDLDLDAIEAAAGMTGAEDVPEPDAQPRVRKSFDDLVESLREDEADEPLLDRSRPLIDFTLPAKDDLDDRFRSFDSGEGSNLFRRLADEEPPLPQLEENGTVSDLIDEVADPDFLNVLALLKGEEPAKESSPASSLSDEDLQRVLDAFYSAEDDLAAGEPGPAPDIDDAFAQGEPEVTRPDDERSPARVILETAQDESTPPDEFSLEQLIASIERQLPEHRPNVQPLPSWLRETEPILAEPDFLPEEPAKVIPMDFTGDLSDQTTRPSGKQRVETRGSEMETEAVDFFSSVNPPAPDVPETFDAFEEFDIESPDVTQPAGAQSPFSPVINMPEDVDATVEPLLLEKFAGTWSDTREIEVIGVTQESDEPAELPEEWPEELTVDEVPVEPSAAGEPEYGYEQAEPQDEERVPVESWSDDDLERETEPEAEPTEPEWQEQYVSEAPLDNETAEPPSLPEEDQVWTGERLPPLVISEEHQFDSALFDTTFDRLAAFDFPDAEILQLQPAIGARPLDDPRIAQVALSLTHASLESTADATLLTRNGEIVAFAGNLTREDLEALRRSVANDWDTSVENARIRFFTLESSGKECMLYSRHTEDDLVLSVLIYGTTKLSDIRRQGDRLLQALRSVPEPVEVEAPPPVTELVSPPAEAEPADIGPLTPYTAVWVLADPGAQLADPVAQAIVSGLTTQLSERRWTVHQIRAEYEYVMVYADMPAEPPQDELIDDLKRRAAAIAHAVDPSLDPETLWADGYLMVTPGRELQLEDIQSYIEFERM